MSCRAEWGGGCCGDGGAGEEFGLGSGSGRVEIVGEGLGGAFGIGLMEEIEEMGVLKKVWVECIVVIS